MSQKKSVLFYIGAPLLISIMIMTTIDFFSQYGLRMKIVIVIADVIAVMAILGWYDSKRFIVAVRILAGIIFLGFASYVLHELYLFVFEGKPFSGPVFEPGSSLAKSIWGFAIFGIPAFLVAARGTLAIKKRKSKVER